MTSLKRSEFDMIGVGHGLTTALPRRMRMKFDFRISSGEVAELSAMFPPARFFLLAKRLELCRRLLSAGKTEPESVNEVQQGAIRAIFRQR
jgi:hypothetical protein